jgi:hypothetical protein
MSRKPKVALSQDFLLNLAKLPAAVQGKMLKWAIRFQTDPIASGFNYETIRAGRDAHVKSVRIDGDWSGIVFVPPRSDLYVLLYVVLRFSRYTSITMIKPLGGPRIVS